MNANNILSADILDIIFENKNKSYGAYELRKTYNKRLVLALGGTMAFCLLFFLSMAFGSRKKGTVELPPTIEVTLANEPNKKEPDPVKPQPVPQQQVVQQTVRVTVPRIVPNDQVKPEDQMKTVDEMDNVKIDVVDREGIKGDLVGSAIPEPKGTGIGTAEVKKEEDYTTEFKTVQIQAKFPGGDAEWRKFLERNLNSSTPVDNGAPSGKYTVIVSFLVDKDGNISEVKAENDPGYGTATEAVRVIKKGPKWIPAVQNGRNVIYRQKQGITFRVDEGE
ncbi:MAG: energy transducer TonB [Filimonas sp.]|nr:energy transducer TonB [Filimonas sp.]